MTGGRHAWRVGVKMMTFEFKSRLYVAVDMLLDGGSAGRPDVAVWSVKYVMSVCRSGLLLDGGSAGRVGVNVWSFEYKSCLSVEVDNGWTGALLGD